MSLGNEEMVALLLIFLRKGIERILVIIVTLLSAVGKVFCRKSVL